VRPIVWSTEPTSASSRCDQNDQQTTSPLDRLRFEIVPPG
jgi:hypothetical protein